jgi:WD40 repeat protein
VEVAHESLLTEWARFAGWVDDARDDLLTRRRLESAAHDWMSSGSDPSFLYRGGRLELAESWAATSGFELTDDEHRFLATSRARVDRDHVVRTRRRRVIVGVLAAALVVAIVGAAIAIVQRNNADNQAAIAAEQQREAERQTNRADSNFTLAEARRIGTQALVEDDFDQALLLAVEGRHLEDSPETQANLLATIQRSPDATAVIRSDAEAFLDLGLTPDGNTLLTSGYGQPNSMAKYDVRTLEGQASVPGSESTPIASSAISPDGRYAAMSSATEDPSVGRTFELHIVDVATFNVVGTLPGLLELPLTRLSFSPDGRYIAAVTDSDQSGAEIFEAYALVWDVAKGGGPIVQYRFSAPNFQRDPAFLPDSKRLLVAGADGTAIVDIASGEMVGEIDGAHPPIAISPNGRTLAAATDTSPGVLIGLFDPVSGRRSQVLAGHRERLVRLDFSPDGTELASGADDRLVMVWDVASGQRRGEYVGHAAGVNALAFSPDGETLWSGGDDRAIFAWDLQRADTLVHLPSPDLADAEALAFDTQGMVIGPGGRDVVFPSTEVRPFQIRELATGALGRPSGVEDGAFISFSPDGKRYLTGDHERLRVWDRDTGALLAVSEPDGYSAFHEGTAVFTPDGREIVALRYASGGAPDDDSLVVLDASTLAPVGGAPVPVGSTGRMVAVTPDGRHAVVVASSWTQDSNETKVLVVDLQTRRIVRATPVEPSGQPFAGARNNTVAPDGRTVGIGGTLGDVIVVDAVSGEVSPLLHAHDGFVESVTFAPDYATFVTTGQDGVVALWDAATQKFLGSVLPLGPNHRVRASFLAADRVLIVYDTGEIFEWDPRPDSWEKYACKVAGRNLTKSEWADQFPGQEYRVTCPDFPAGA